MPLVNTVALLEAAHKDRYCVGAFNIVDYLTLEAVIRAAERKHAPVIIQTSTGTVRRYGPYALVEMTRWLADRSPVPVALHLDHGKDRTLIHDCIVAGYTSVMIDASDYPFDENVARTKDVVEEAHKYGLSVEAEIGVVAGVEDDIVVHQDDAIYTTPEEALRFYAQTQVDFLAVAIGTAHGLYKVEPKLNIDALREIRSHADFPLVIHGGSGLPFAVVKQLVEAGGSKLNVSTQLKRTYIDSLYQYISEHREEYNPMRLLDKSQESLIEMIGSYITVLGSDGRA
ncbi:MAG: class II fructose-bisphosphate aldolase [Anaerolineae bacterium]|nr:class II fructose-bisphosphate aldolase [Anaerolineae bacterium]